MSIANIRVAAAATLLIASGIALYAPQAGAVAGNPGLNLGQVDSGKDASSLRQSSGAIVYATGNLVQPESDFGSQGEMGLFLTRSFDNYWGGVGIFGAKWFSNFDYKLSFTTSASTDPCYPKPGAVCTTPPTGTMPLWAHLPDGRRIEYLYNSSLGLWQEVKPSPLSSIMRNADGTYTMLDDHNGVQHYSATGYVLSITNASNVGWTFAYDANNYLQTVTHTSGRAVHFTWSGGQLASVTDPNGTVFSYTYLANQPSTGLNLLSSTTINQSGSPLSTTHYYYEDSRYPGALTGKDYNGTRYSTYGYDANGFAASPSVSGTQAYNIVYTPGANNTLTVVETNPLGRQTTYNFSNGLVTSSSATGGANVVNASNTHSYDANGYDSQVTDFNGNITKYAYAANGQLQQKVEAYGTSIARTTNYTWDSTPGDNRPLSVTMVGDHETDYTYDPTTKRAASVTVKNLSANGVANQVRTTTFSYTTNGSNGLLTSMTADGPLTGTGDAVTSAYNATGDVVSVTNSLNQAATYSGYNGLGQPGQVVGANGDTVNYTYNVRGQTTNLQTHPNGTAANTVYSYDPTGLLNSVTTPDGVTETYIYNSARQLTSKSRPANSTIAGGATTEQESYTRDVAGDVTEVDDYAVGGSGTTNTLKLTQTYDGLGRLWASTGNNSQNVRTNYDANGNVSSVVDSLNHTTTYAYDALNRRITATDANNGIANIYYDGGSRVNKVTDPRGLNTTYSFDGFGQLWSQSSPDTGTVSFTWDVAGRKTGLTRADGKATTYNYDALSRVTSITASGATQAFTYDNCTNGSGRFCSVTDGFDTHTVVLSRSYSPEGLIASESDNIGGSQYNNSFAYDNMGQLSTLTFTNGEQVHYTYANGRATAVTYMQHGNWSNVATGITYQPYADTAAWAYGNGLTRTKSYDLDGRLTGVSTSVPGVSVQQSLTFQFDANNAITAITNGVNTSLTQSFGYDALERLTGVTSSSGKATWTYDADSNRVSESRDLNNVNGLNGNYSIAGTSNEVTVATTGHRFTYDANGNRLTDNNNGLSFHYDPFNRMDQSTKSGVNTRYHVNPLGQRIFKWTASAQSGEFTYAPGSNNLLSETDGNGHETNYVWLNGELVGMVRNSDTVYAISTDQLGRPELVTDPSQNVVWRANNYTFTRTVTLDNIGGLNIGFPGQYYDSEDGLWSNGFRDYDAAVGRYVESDPLGLNAGLNSFAYAGNNPVSFIDEFGLKWTDSPWVSKPIFYFSVWYGFQVGTGVAVVTKSPGWGSVAGAVAQDAQQAEMTYAVNQSEAGFHQAVNAFNSGVNSFTQWVNNQVWTVMTTQTKAAAATAQSESDDGIQYVDPNAPPVQATNLPPVTVTGQKSGDQQSGQPATAPVTLPPVSATAPHIPIWPGTSEFDHKFSGAFLAEIDPSELSLVYPYGPVDDPSIKRQ